jgi:hypothetical protein
MPYPPPAGLEGQLAEEVLDAGVSELWTFGLETKSIHYQAERPHQGLQNALVSGGPTLSEGRVEVRGRLSGLLKYDHRQAA